MMVMAVEMMMMMIPMKSGVKVMTMVMISTSGRGFPRQISPCRRAFSLSVVSVSEEAAEYFLDGSPTLRVLGEEVHERVTLEVGQGLLTRARRG